LRIAAVWRHLAKKNKTNKFGGKFIMKKILTILAAFAMFGALALNVCAYDNAKLTQNNEITVYAPKDGEDGGKIQLTVSGNAALDTVVGDKAIAMASDDKKSVGIIYTGAVKAGDAVAKLTFTGAGEVIINGVDGDFTGLLGTFDVSGGGGDITVPTDPDTSGNGGSGSDRIPPTGVVFAIVPFALAGAAAIASRKRK